jgi:glyoxylase-like metal-dependent hydrolase (beta-lactamase superfamily II)
MSNVSDTYELFAIKYARRDGWRCDNFIGGDDDHQSAMPLDYYVWVARNSERAVLIDTGFNAEVAAKRGRGVLRCPIDSLRLVGIDPDAVSDVVITHLHYDHVGNFTLLPAARFHLQETEMHFATGRHMKYRHFAHHYEPDDVAAMVKMNFAQRVVMHDGPVDLAPGIQLQPVGGHTPGLQVVRVKTARGWVVVASDASHFYDNIENRRPFSNACDVCTMLEAYDTVYRLADSKQHVIPGHDPQVLERYPAPTRELEGIVARLDVAPNEIAR